MKIKCTNFFYNELLCMWYIFCTCAFCMQLPLDPRHLLLDFCCLIICSSLSELDNACHTNEMVVYHEASRSLCRFDHTPQSQSDPMLD